MRRRLLSSAALVVTALVAAACSSDGSRATRPSSSSSSSTTSTTAGSTSTTAAPDPHKARFKLTKVAAVQSPTAMAVRTGDDTLYVTEQVGRVRAVRNGALAP